MKNKLNQKQIIFANAILEGKTQREAYKLAKYKGKDIDAGASEIIRNPNVSAFLEKKRAIIEEKTEVSVEWILKNLKFIVDFCSTPQKAFGGGLNIDSRGATKALELLGKYKNMFKEKIEHSGELKVTGRLFDDVKSKKGK